MILLDTCAYLYATFEPAKLSPGAVRVISSRSRQLAWSPVSTWEIVTKAALGRMDYPENALAYLDLGLRELNAVILPFEQQHALAGAQLPHHHRDPFDRMLIAQALHEGLSVVTADRQWAAYGVNVIW